MAEQKLSTAEILAKIKAEKTGGVSSPPAASAPPPATEPIAETATPPKPATTSKAAPAAKSGSPADILAAIRSQGAPKASGDATAQAAAKTPAKPTASGVSTTDILAAIRGKGGAAAPASSATPAAKTATAVASRGPNLSVEEMLKAVRGEGAAKTAQAASLVTKPDIVLQIPLKPPAASAKKKSVDAERRTLLAVCCSAVVIGFSAMAATALASLLATARFMFPNVLVEPPTRFKIGSSSDYPLGGVSTKWLAARGVWIVHTDQYKGKDLIYAIASVCTHLGCTPNWLEGEQKYKCPCHGSGFYVTGINFEGPAPRPLERVGIRVAPDGQLEVDKSVKFQEEMGQWEDPNSFVDASTLA